MERDGPFGGNFNEILERGMTQVNGTPKRDFILTKQFERCEVSEGDGRLQWRTVPW